MKKAQIKVVVVEAGHLSQIAVSGGDKLIQQMLPNLKKDIKFEIIIPKIATVHWQTKKGLKIHQLPSLFLEKYPNLPPVVFCLYIWRSIFLVIYLAKIKRPYVLYTSSAELADWLAPYLIKTFCRGIRWIVRIHHFKSSPEKRSGNYLVNYLSFNIEKLGLNLFKKADLIIALNQNISEKLKKNIPSVNIEILGAGIDFRKIRSFKVLPKTPKYAAVFIGRIHYTKGILDLPKIWKLVTKEIPNAKLVICGELSIPALERSLMNEIKNNKLQKSIDVLGYVPEDKIFSLLKSSKLFLFTDHEAGFGLAAAEAMAMGLPVVGWDIGILGTVYKSGYRKASFGNYSLFASIIIDLLKDKYSYKKLSKDAIDEAKTHDWQKVSNKFLRFLNGSKTP